MVKKSIFCKLLYHRKCKQRGGWWSKKAKYCKRSLWTPPYCNLHMTKHSWCWKIPMPKCSCAKMSYNNFSKDCNALLPWFILYKMTLLRTVLTYIQHLLFENCPPRKIPHSLFLNPKIVSNCSPRIDAWIFP